MLHNVYQFHVAPKQLCKGGIDHCSPECAWDPLYPGEPELFNHSVAPWATALKLLAIWFQSATVSWAASFSLFHAERPSTHHSFQHFQAVTRCWSILHPVLDASLWSPGHKAQHDPHEPTAFLDLKPEACAKGHPKRSSTTTKRYRDSKGQNGFSFTKQLKQSQNLASFEYFTCSSWWHLHILCCTFMLHGLKFILTSRFPQHEALGIDGNGLI